MKIKHYVDLTTLKTCVFFINHKNPKVVNYCVPGITRIEELNMVNITTINFGKSNGNFTEKPEHPDVLKANENRCLTIRQSKDF